MKLLKILFIISLMISVVACKPSTEDKMLKSLQTTQFGKNIKIISVDIIDTLYDKQVADTLEFDRNMVHSTEQMRMRMMKNRDSMYQHRMGIAREKMDSFRTMSNKQVQTMERMRDFHNQRMWRMQDLQLTGADSDIAVYDVLIRTEKDTLEFYISKNFRVLGPKFIFENVNKEQRHFNPMNGMRRGRQMEQNQDKTMIHPMFK